MKNLPDEALDILIEEATVDCYDEKECRAGFLACLQDNLQTPFKAKVIGKPVVVEEIDGNDVAIKAIVTADKHKYEVNILDLEVSSRTKGLHWLVAYRKWEEC